MKVARPVLRGPRRGNAPGLPDNTAPTTSPSFGLRWPSFPASTRDGGLWSGSTVPARSTTCWAGGDRRRLGYSVTFALPAYRASCSPSSPSSRGPRPTTAMLSPATAPALLRPPVGSVPPSIPGWFSLSNLALPEPEPSLVRPGHLGLRTDRLNPATCLPHTARRWGPKRPGHRLLSVFERLMRQARRDRLHLPEKHP